METIVAICWRIWCTRNKITFEKRVVRTPLETVFTVCSFMMYWSGLMKGDDKAKFQAGVNMMVRVATSLADRSTSRVRLALEQGS